MDGDWDECRLLPATLTLTFGATAALFEALAAVLEGIVPLAVPALAAGVALLLASRVIRADRRWSLRVGSWAALFGVPVWLAALAAGSSADGASAAVVCGAGVAASLWTHRFLAGELVDPYAPAKVRATVAGAAVGWIEDLPAEPIPWRSGPLGSSRESAAPERLTASGR